MEHTIRRIHNVPPRTLLIGIQRGAPQKDIERHSTTTQRYRHQLSVLLLTYFTAQWPAVKTNCSLIKTPAQKRTAPSFLV